MCYHIKDELKQLEELKEENARLKKQLQNPKRQLIPECELVWIRFLLTVMAVLFLLLFLLVAL